MPGATPRVACRRGGALAEAEAGSAATPAAATSATAIATVRRTRGPALRPYGRRLLGDPGGLAQRVGLVGLLPGEVVVLAAEVAVGRRLLVDRPVQVEVLAERAR